MAQEGRSPPAPNEDSATVMTRAAQDGVRQRLPLADHADFNNATRGLVAQTEDGRILNLDGSVAWDTGGTIS